MLVLAALRRFIASARFRLVFMIGFAALAAVPSAASDSVDAPPELHEAVSEEVLQDDAGLPPPPVEQIDHAAENLTAQRKIAAWTERLGWTAMAQAGLSVFGFSLLLLTLWETRKAARAAMSSADAAQQSVAHMRDATQIDLRAYVFVDSSRSKGRKIVTSIQNTGRTPAVNMVVKFAALVAPYPLMEVHADWEYGSSVAVALGGGQKYQVTFPMPDVQGYVDQVSRGHRAIFLHVIISYADIFEQQHEESGYYASFDMFSGEGCFFVCEPPRAT